MESHLYLDMIDTSASLRCCWLYIVVFLNRCRLFRWRNDCTEIHFYVLLCDEEPCWCGLHWRKEFICNTSKFFTNRLFTYRYSPRDGKYDWRLAPSKLQERDGWFHTLKSTIEEATQINNEKVVLVGHSMGRTVLYCVRDYITVQIHRYPPPPRTHTQHTQCFPKCQETRCCCIFFNGSKTRRKGRG